MYPLPVNMTGMVSWGQYVNTVTDGLFWPFMSFFLSGVFFLTFMTIDDTKRAFVGASVINLILNLIFFIMGFINIWVLVVSIGLAFGSVIYLLANNEYLG